MFYGFTAASNKMEDFHPFYKKIPMDMSNHKLVYFERLLDSWRGWYDAVVNDYVYNG